MKFIIVVADRWSGNRRASPASVLVEDCSRVSPTYLGPSTEKTGVSPRERFAERGGACRFESNETLGSDRRIEGKRKRRRIRKTRLNPPKSDFDNVREIPCTVARKRLTKIREESVNACGFRSKRAKSRAKIYEEERNIFSDTITTRTKTNRWKIWHSCDFASKRSIFW